MEVNFPISGVPFGELSPAWLIQCGCCQGIDVLFSDSREEAEVSAQECGWKPSEIFGWVCRGCKAYELVTKAYRDVVSE